MTYTTKIEKSTYNGWNAETLIELEKISDTETRFLDISTSKGHTIASAHILKDEPERGFTSKNFIMFQDYRQTVCKNDIKRNTEKAIEAAHAEALKLIQPHIEAAKAQYNIA